MSSLASRLLKPGAKIRFEGSDGPLPEEGRRFILNAVKINAQNVMDYIRGREEQWISYRDDLPNLAPPFEEMWFEYNCGGRKVGVAMISNESRISEVRWWIAFMVFVAVGGRVHAATQGTWPIRPDGSLNMTAVREVRSSWEILPEEAEDWSDQELANFLTAPVLPALMAVTFMNCRNVDMVDMTPPKRGKSKAMKHRKKPKCEWKVLVIDPVKKVLDGERGEHRGESLARRLSICRGHFKDYRASGLFGKHKGVYWWHDHLRGDEAEGTIHKTYEVKTEGLTESD